MARGLSGKLLSRIKDTASKASFGVIFDHLEKQESRLCEASSRSRSQGGRLAKGTCQTPVAASDRFPGWTFIQPVFQKENIIALNKMFISLTSPISSI